jgi:hypothetical protein
MLATSSPLPCGIECMIRAQYDGGELSQDSSVVVGIWVWYGVPSEPGQGQGVPGCVWGDVVRGVSVSPGCGVIPYTVESRKT